MTSPTGRHPALVSCLGAAPGVDQPAASALQSGQQSSLGREEDAMADAAVHQESAPAAHTAWPAGISRVPYWLYQDPAVLRSEQQRIFEGPVWNYLCLEADIPAQGDYRTTFVGAMSVIVVRGAEGAIHAFENRCAHRGALIAFEDAGTVKEFTCVYHAWRYDLEGNLRSVAFQRGVGGKGGMSAEFCMEQNGPRKLRVATIAGLVFGSLAADAPALDDYIGSEISQRIRRVLRKPVAVIGRFTQPLPNNWKLYAENVKDTYHASLLHLFFTTFNITRFGLAGGVTVSPSGAHHASTTIGRTEAQDGYKDEAIRSDSDFRLHDPSLLNAVDEFGDGIQVQILTVFPSLVLQQIHNCLAVRQIVPRGADTMDLHWTYIGFDDDTKEMRRRRLKQSNLVGPAGYISMEDGCIGGFVQRAAGTAGDAMSVVQMGGETAESQPTRLTEAAVRGFWQTYRAHMGI
jgi:phenylpropionate dioxygenase-like ring-hydroxylating dioxygenase large terminal subunit